MAKFLDIRYLYFLKMFQWIKIRFCVSNQKFVPSFFKVYPNRFYISSFLHTFLRKIPWKLYDPFITFKLQVWRMNYLHISKSFSVCLWNIFENITRMPLRGHLLEARTFIPRAGQGYKKKHWNKVDSTEKSITFSLKYTVRWFTRVILWRLYATMISLLR